MKLADKKPEAIKSVVRLSANQCALFYAKPVCMGVIRRVGAYWYSSDGTRFVSTRDALKYHIKLHEGSGNDRDPEPTTPSPKTTKQEVIKPKIIGAVGSASRRKTDAEGNSGGSDPTLFEQQLIYREFIAFLDYKKSKLREQQATSTDRPVVQQAAVK